MLSKPEMSCNNELMQSSKMKHYNSAHSAKQRPQELTHCSKTHNEGAYRKTRAPCSEANVSAHSIICYFIFYLRISKTQIAPIVLGRINCTFKQSLLHKMHLLFAIVSCKKAGDNISEHYRRNVFILLVSQKQKPP